MCFRSYSVTLLLYIFLLSVTSDGDFDRSIYSWKPIITNEDSIGKGGENRKQPIYISLTTTSFRIDKVYNCVNSLLTGSVIPDQIYVFVSSSPFLLDKGVTKADVKASGLLDLAASKRLSIIFTDNIGPHRKLLPLLLRKWTEDCIIITVDDDNTYKPIFLERMMKAYDQSSHNSVIAMRTRRIGYCVDVFEKHWKPVPYSRKGHSLWPLTTEGVREQLTLPTGTGGILYRPSFVDPRIIFSVPLMKITQTGDDILFRLATMATGTSVVTACNPLTQEQCGSVKYPKTKDSAKLLPLPAALTGSRNLLQDSDEVEHIRELRKISLWEDGNQIRDHNNVMLAAAGEYLSENKLFKFQEFVNKAVMAERRKCLVKAVESSKRNNVATQDLTMLQSYDGKSKPEENSIFLSIFRVCENITPSKAFDSCGLFRCAHRFRDKAGYNSSTAFAARYFPEF